MGTIHSHIKLVSMTSLNLTIIIINNLFSTPKEMLINLLITTSCCLMVGLCIECNVTHFEFFSNYSLGKNDELNKTFTQIGKKLIIDKTTYFENSYTIYTIQNITAKLNYLDSNQHAAIPFKDIIAISGGLLQITITFNWTQFNLVTPKNGWAIARALTLQVTFSKLLEQNQGYLDFKLDHFYPITLNFSNFTLTRVQPGNITDTIKLGILNALNLQNTEFVNTKTQVVKAINQDYENVLASNLKNEHYPLDDHFTYEFHNRWADRNDTVNYTLIPLGHDLEQKGLSLTFVSAIRDYAGWQCGRLIPTQELDIAKYGGLQELVSISIIENTIRYAFEHGFLNTVLTRINWQSSFFQFFAGDLFEVIPYTANKFLPIAPVEGTCVYNSQQPVVIKRHSDTSINSSSFHTCSLLVGSDKVADFDVKLGLVVDADVNYTHLNFKVREAEGVPTFRNVGQFEVKNKELGTHMLNHCLNRLRNETTFGSGWKVFPRDYPHILIFDDYFAVYDSSHINSLHPVFLPN